MTQPNRRQSDMTAAEAAYRKGLRRRASDRADGLAYWAVLLVMMAVFVTIGVLSWLAR